jgi:hypothetical protein
MLVEYNKKKVEEAHLQELKTSLAETVSADPPLPVADAIALVQDKKKEWMLPDSEVVKVCICGLLAVVLADKLFLLDCMPELQVMVGGRPCVRAIP